MYERISNYVANHSDIENCNINQLYSLSNQIDVPIDDYNFNFPPELRNRVNKTFSIPTFI